MWRFGSAETSSKIIANAEQVGWLKSLSMLPKNKAEWIKGTGRFPISILASPKGRLLDAGCGWGGVAFWMAPEFDCVYALDAKLDGLKFINIRASQDNQSNIVTVMGSVFRLPFPDNFFDVILLNGVLEWVGTFSSAVSPEKLQLTALKEMKRVIQPEGALYVAIENRYGLQYFAGYKEEHTGLRYISLLPRKLANKYHKLKRGDEFRALTHSRYHLKKLLNLSGFNYTKFFSVFPSYRNCRYAVSIPGVGAIRFLLRMVRVWHGRWSYKLAIALLEKISHYPALLEAAMFFSPSWLVFASPTSKPTLSVNSTPTPQVIEHSSGKSIAVTINNRRANFFQIKGISGDLDKKYSLSLTSLAKDKIKTSTLILDIIREINPDLEDNLPRVSLYETRSGRIECTKAVAAHPLSLSDICGIRAFYTFISSFSLLFIPDHSYRRVAVDFDIRDTFSELALKYQMGEDVFNLLENRQVIHGDLNTNNILLVRQHKALSVVLIDFEHVKIGPAVFNWYDFLLRNYILQGGNYPLSPKMAIRRFEKFPGNASAEQELTDLTAKFLTDCHVPLSMHSLLTRLYFLYLNRDDIVAGNEVMNIEIERMDLQL